MPLCNTYRSFAIYFLIVVLISESPVSAFTLKRTRTTTLKSADLDLSAEGSALLEVQSVQSKLENERDFTKFGIRKSSIRNSANVLGADKKFASGGTKPIQPTTVKLPNENNYFTTPSEHNTTRKDKETAARIIFGRGQKFKSRTEFTTNAAIQNISSEGATVSGTEPNVRNREDDKSQNVSDNDYSSTSTKFSDSSDTDETQTTDFTTTDKPTEDTSIVPLENDEDSTADAKTVKDETTADVEDIKEATTRYTVTVKEETTADAEANKEETTTDAEAVTEETTTDTKIVKEETTTDTKTVKGKTTTDTKTVKEETTTDTETVKAETTTDTETVKAETTTDTETVKAETTTDTETVKAETTTDTETVTEETTTDTKTAEEETTTDAETTNKDIIKVTKKFTTPQTGTINFRIDYTTLSDTKRESTSTDSTTLQESMVGEFSSSSSQDPSWKKYTVIERKRTNPTTEADSLTTEMTEELEKSESVSLKVTIENTGSTSTPQEHHDLLSESTTSGTENVTLSSTLPAFNNAPETRTEQLPSTRPLHAETTTEVKIRESLASRRAGYLDLSAKQEADEATTTELFEDGKFNETELIESAYEIESQDNEGPELKNPAHKAQGQLAEDAIKEELLKEEVISDHEENSKRYSEERQDLNRVKPLDLNLDESLSVKPIGKGSLYTSRSNYRPMKKIEVQPLKPYVRDPDDNSWRNESLSYLGIVFKAKNASKPFTQVLKNKTEAELNNWSEKENKNEVPDLRERLEKIAEERKSKKKKLNQYGEIVYNDYEAENSGETSSTPKPEAISMPVMDLFSSPPTTASPRTEATQRTTTPEVYMYKEESITTTKTPKKFNKFAEYYDTNDEDDAEYLSLTKIDLKKFTTRLFDKETMTTLQPMTVFTKSMKTMLPERRPTVQYFPPRREPQKVNVNDYDSDFQRKVNMFSYSESPKSFPVSETIPPATMEYKTMQYLKETSPMPGVAHQYKPSNLAKNVYVTFPPRVVDHKNRYPASNDESFNRASYVIKHYKDLIDAAIKDDYDKSAEFMAYTEAPLVGVTIKDKENMKTHMDDDYDYETNIRKDILNRFVDNFNQNSERFKVDFPILYNSSVVHMQADDGGKVVASSSAFLKRQYGDAPARPCCDMKVELSPAYELHYYVPDQEEKEEAEKPATMPFNYRL